MGATISTIDNLLKRQYLDDVLDYFEESEGIVGKIWGRRKPAQGGDSYLSVRLSRSGAVGFRGDGDTLPTASNQGWGQHNVTPRALYGRIQVSGLAMDRTSGGKAKAFLEAFASESEHIVSYMKKRSAIYLWGAKEGYLGEIASVNDGTDTITMQVASRTGAWDVMNFNAGTRYVPYAGEFGIDIIDSDGSTVHNSGLTVSSVSHSDGTITFSGTPDLSNVAAGDFIAVDRPDSTWSATHWEGLQAAIDDGSICTTYHGLSRITYPILKSNRLEDTSANRPINDNLLEDLCETVFVNSGRDPSMGKYEIVVSPSLYARYVSTLLPVKRFNTSKLEGGHASVDFNGIPLVRDLEAPYGCAYLVDWDSCYFMETTPLQFRTKDGQALLRTANTDEYEARLVWYGNLLVKNLHSMGVLCNLEDSPYYIR